MSISEDIAQQFNDSLERCKRNSLFIKEFYVHFFSSDALVRHIFAHTDMERQIEMLRGSLHMIMLVSQQPETADECLSHTAEIHHRLNIPPYLYDVWLESLIHTVSTMDPKYDADIENAWRAIMRTGIDYMKAYGNPDQP
ncbi:MAG TPA: globin [Steroidobacteraceae bacterium]|nr:globin [Steroidobacteraceae bacterium]